MFNHKDFARVFGSYSGPFIVKPVNGRASQYVEYVNHALEVPGMVSWVGQKTNGGVRGCVCSLEEQPTTAFGDQVVLAE